MQPMAKKSSGALVTVQTPGLFLRTQALRSAVKKPPAMSRGFLCSEYLAYISQIGESRRADSNRCPAPATSDPSGVAGSCRGSQIPHIKAAFSAQACCVLHRIAFPVVSEWYQNQHHTFVRQLVVVTGRHEPSDRRSKRPHAYAVFHRAHFRCSPLGRSSAFVRAPCAIATSRSGQPRPN